MLIRDGIEDLEVLLNRVYDKEIKELVKEAIGCYSQGFYRASIISLWNSIIYDSFKKAKYLVSNLNDPDSESLLKEINKMIEDQNYRHELNLIKEYLCKKLQMINPHNVEQLENIQKLRNKCSHPSFAENDKIYTPYPEEVRASIRVAVEIVLSKKPFLGKKILDKIIEDIQSPYFANTIDDFKDILYDKYLNQSDIYLKTNLLKLSAKKIFHKNIDFNEKRPFGRVLIAISKNNQELINSENLENILDNVTDENIEHFFDYIADVNNLEHTLSKTTLNKIQTYIKKNNTMSATAKLRLKYYLSIKGVLYKESIILKEIKKSIEENKSSRIIRVILRRSRKLSNKNIESLSNEIINIIPNIGGFQSAENFINMHLSLILKRLKNETFLKKIFKNILENKASGYNQFLEAGQAFSNLETIINALHSDALNMKCFEEFINKVNDKFLDPNDGIFEELTELIEKRKSE